MSNSVGRGHPPVETRFKKGQSGNPGGRPKLSRAAAPSAFDIIDRTLTVQLNGAARELTVDEALEQKTYQLAIAGDRRAQREVLKMIVAHEHAKSNSTGGTPRVEVRDEGWDPENTFEAMRLLDIAHFPERRPPSLQSDAPLLEPWAVQAALDRRGLGALTEDDVSLIEKWTRGAETLRWPKRSRHD
jgi:Family of unknown function (DUF5681)